MMIVIAVLAAPAPAQERGRAAPRPKTVEVEVKDPLKQAAALFEAGQNAHQAGDLEKAVGLYDEALRREPSLWQAEFQRGVALVALGRGDEAGAALRRVTELLGGPGGAPDLRPHAARAQIILGEMALDTAQPAEAERAFRRALELDPKAARAHAGLAEMFLQGNKAAEAAAEARAAVAAGDQSAAAYLLLGEAQTLAGQTDEALGSLNAALEREPQNAAARRYRAEVFIARRDWPAAIADLRASLAAERSAPTALRLAQAYGEAGQPAEAAALYEQVLKEEPDNAEARAGLAGSRIDAGRGAEAIGDLEALVKAEPKRAAYRAQLAELYLAAQPEQALAQYRAAAELEPRVAGHRIGVGAALVKLRRFPEAVETLRQVLAENPPDEVGYFAHTNLATALFEQDDYANAAREYVWILRHQRDQKRAAVTLYFLGICFDKLGDYEQALKAYNQFLELAPPDNQLEIDKVKLRLPSLQRQIKEGKGKKR